VIGALQALMVTVKGLPLAYNRDLQEDRYSLFDGLETTAACARITAGMFKTLTVHRDRYEQELTGDFLLATELADHLASNGVPFRDAHHVSGRIVGHLEARGENFSALDLDALRTFHPAFGDDALAWLEPRAAAERRASLGGTAPSQIDAQVDALAAWLDRQES
jgi:argininosuccinate lyase